MIKAIIIDDEPKALKLLEGYIQHFTEIQLLNTFRNGFKAFEYLEKEDVDIVFLDINMPHLSGISLSKMIKPETGIIFTTAYSEFAAESYEVNALDYLLKPISLERFTKTIGKILKPKNQPSKEYLFVKSGSAQHRLKLEDICYLEKEGNYITYHMKEDTILARQSIPEALKSLPQNFIQTHKSFIINTHKVKFIDKDEIGIATNRVPIGQSFKETVKSIINSN